MKKAVLFFALLALIGCAYEGQSLRTYFEDPRALIRDPQFTEYKEQRDSLESQYLSKEITYAEYVEKMDVLDEEYAREATTRDAKIRGE